MVKGYFFDTYALYEILRGNERYLTAVDGAAMLTTRLNLMELHYGLLAYGEAYADNAYDALLPFVIEIDDVAVKRANRLRKELKKRKLSYVDCVGYTLACAHGVLFLTGDRQFNGMEHVEFLT